MEEINQNKDVYDCNSEYENKGNGNEVLSVEKNFELSDNETINSSILFSQMKCSKNIMLLVSQY